MTLSFVDSLSLCDKCCRVGASLFIGDTDRPLRCPNLVGQSDTRIAVRLPYSRVDSHMPDTLGQCEMFRREFDSPPSPPECLVVIHMGALDFRAPTFFMSYCTVEYRHLSLALVSELVSFSEHDEIVEKRFSERNGGAQTSTTERASSYSSTTCFSKR